MASNTRVGLPIGNNYTLISDTKVLNTINGSVSDVRDVLKTVTVVSSSVLDASIANKVEVVVGIEGKKIDFVLASSEGTFESFDGFLVEVYLSGANGVLTRVYQQDVVDVVNDDRLSEGFSNYLTLKVDEE
jgi:hypothetical protein